jgi:hypothetical protein
MTDDEGKYWECIDRDRDKGRKRKRGGKSEGEYSE